MKKIYQKILALLVKIELDKYLHFIVGMLAALFFGATLSLGWSALLLVFLLGLGKELYDYYYGSAHLFSWQDLLATTLGGFCAIILLIPKL